MTHLAGMCSNMSAEGNYQKTVCLNKAGEPSLKTPNEQQQGSKTSNKR